MQRVALIAFREDISQQQSPARLYGGNTNLKGGPFNGGRSIEGRILSLVYRVEP